MPLHSPSKLRCCARACRRACLAWDRHGIERWTYDDLTETSARLDTQATLGKSIVMRSVARLRFAPRSGKSSGRIRVVTVCWRVSRIQNVGSTVGPVDGSTTLYDPDQMGLSSNTSSMHQVGAWGRLLRCRDRTSQERGTIASS
jgi:hypothetical protein